MFPILTDFCWNHWIENERSKKKKIGANTKNDAINSRRFWYSWGFIKINFGKRMTQIISVSDKRQVQIAFFLSIQNFRKAIYLQGFSLEKPFCSVSDLLFCGCNIIKSMFWINLNCSIQCILTKTANKNEFFYSIIDIFDIPVWTIFYMVVYTIADQSFHNKLPYSINTCIS